MRVNQQKSILSSTPNTSAKAKSLLRRKTLNTFENHEHKKKRRKPGVTAIRQIKYYQKTTDLLLRALPFQRLIREIVETTLIFAGATKFRWKATAILALQTAAEAYLIALFEDSNKSAIHAKRVTIRPEDLRLVRTLRSRVDENEHQ